MNTNLLNQGLLGTRRRTPYQFGSGATNMILSGSLTPVIHKRFQLPMRLALHGRLLVPAVVFGKCTARLKLTPTLSATKWKLIFARLEGALRLAPSLTVTHLALKWQSLSQSLSLHLSGAPKIRRAMQLPGTLKLSMSGEGKRITLVFMQLNQLLRLGASLKARDRLTRTDAPDERTSGIVDITTRTTATVVIGDY